MPESVIRIYRSNRTEVLADALGQLLEVPVGGPFDAECLVVQSHGMAAWLNHELARRFSVWAHADFLFPRNFVGRALRAVPAEQAAEGGWATGRLLWAVLATLPDCLPRREFARLKRYIGEDPQGVRRFQLARRIARTFDQYLTYRPDMVLAWERGDDGDLRARGQQWQAVLWRALVERLGAGHVAASEAAFVSALAAGQPVVGLPSRVSLFGIASLPPLYVRVLAALAEHVDLHLFLLSPLRGAGTDGDRHPLLASLGELGVEFDHVLREATTAANVALRSEELFVAPEPDTMLGRLQADILRGGVVAPAPVSPGPATRSRRSETPHPTLPFATGGPEQLAPACAPDGTIQLHSCHGPMREVEVLHDQLLDLLAQDTGIEPRDVAVMMADVETYAPLVEAVFGRDQDDAQFIPYRIADRKVRGESPVVEAFQRMLTLVGGRTPASEVLDLLRLEPVQRRFGLQPRDLDQLTHWVVESGTRWGVDAEDRGRHDQPEVAQNTWRFGLARMFLGYAMPTEGRETYADILPFDEIEGQSAELLGRLAEFCERLFTQLAALREPRPLEEWRDVLGELLESMLAQDSQTAWEHQRIRMALADLVELAADAGFDEPVDLAILRALLEPQIDEAHPERGFLSRGVTFCAFLPMRSIPFKVVCMLGMSDGSFPRVDRGVDFDLMTRGERRPGDRLRRTDDRYLFLEAVLAARERVIVTYTGQSIRDNSAKPPSVLVAETVDVLQESYGVRRDDLIVRHPLQGFSREYFDSHREDRRLFSYAQTYLEGAESLAPGRRTARQLFAEVLPAAADGETVATLALDELVRFVRSPVQYLLNRRLSIYLGDTELDIPDREPLELDPLRRYQVGDRLLELQLAGVAAEDSLELERARGALPPGALGACEHEDVHRTADEIVQAVARWRRGLARPGLRVWHTLPDGVRLVGTLDDLWPTAQVHYQFSRIRPKHLLAAWVRHLVLCWVAGPEDPKETVLAGRDEVKKHRFAQWEDVCRVYRWRPVDDPAAELQKLVALMEPGLRAPLRFLPQASHDYVQSLLRDQEEAKALDVAIRSWTGRSSERQFDAHLRRVFGGLEPPFDEVVTAGPPFGELAIEIFGPLLAHREEERA